MSHKYTTPTIRVERDDMPAQQLTDLSAVLTRTPYAQQRRRMLRTSATLAVAASAATVTAAVYAYAHAHNDVVSTALAWQAHNLTATITYVVNLYAQAVAWVANVAPTHVGDGLAKNVINGALRWTAYVTEHITTVTR